MTNTPTRAFVIAFISLILAACATNSQDGSPSWSGGARHERVTETDYIVTSSTNGGSGPARLRPLLLARARQIASSAGYSGFLVRSPILEYPRFGDGHVAIAAVKLVKTEPIAPPGSEYFFISPRTTEPPLAPMETATLIGSASTESSEMKGSFTPWYVDALDSIGGFFERRTLALRPGNQTIGVHFYVCKPYFSACRQGSVMLRATLAAGGTYRVTGEIKNGAAFAWIVDTKTETKIAHSVISSSPW